MPFILGCLPVNPFDLYLSLVVTQVKFACCPISLQLLWITWLCQWPQRGGIPQYISIISEKQIGTTLLNLSLQFLLLKLHLIWINEAQRHSVEHTGRWRTVKSVVCKRHSASLCHIVGEEMNNLHNSCALQGTLCVNAEVLSLKSLPLESHQAELKWLNRSIWSP